MFSLFPCPISSVTDFSDQPITVEVPANGGGIFTLSEFFTIVDDNVDEYHQSFAIVAEIGPDVPDIISCFRLYVWETECHGRGGATEIRINDNDCELWVVRCFSALHSACMRSEGCSIYLAVCPSVYTTFSVTTRKKSEKERYTGLILKRRFFESFGVKSK